MLTVTNVWPWSWEDSAKGSAMVSEENIWILSQRLTAHLEQVE